MPHEPRYRKGDKIGGRYQVHQALAGGMGEVYLCLAVEEMIPVALKTFQSRFLASAKLRTCFEREAATWVALEKHPNIVGCAFMQTVDNTPFLFLEWVAGEEGYGTDLRDWLDRRGPLEPRRALEFTLDVCRALAHAQKKVPGFVHCDIKPENVLVAQGQLAKLTDFGLAQVVRESGLVSPDAPAPAAGARWQVSSAGGTPPYMAPEQWLEEAVDARTDVYAVGCLLYELLTGHWPFQAATLDGLRRLHLQSPLPPLRAGPTGPLGGGLDRVLKRCLAKEKGERYSSASDLLDAISRLYQDWHGEPPRGVVEAGEFTAADYGNRAITYSELGRYDEAFADFDAAIRLDPSSAHSHFNRGITYVGMGRCSEALADYDVAIRLDPNYAKARLNRGHTYAALGLHTDALADYDAAIRINAKFAEAHLNRGGTYIALGRHAEALADFDVAIRINPKYADAHVNRGITYKTLRRQAEALADFDVAIRINPNHAVALANRGMTYDVLGRHTEALADLDAAIRLDPNVASTYLSRGCTYVHLGRHAEALADFDAAIRLDPNFAEAHCNRGHHNFGLGRHADALADYSAAIRLDPDDGRTYTIRADTYHLLGRHDEALADYDAAIRLDPNDATAHYSRGVTYRALGRRAEALADYDAAIRLDPNDTNAYVNRGNIYAERERHAEALADWDAAIRLDPNLAQAHYNRGSIYAALNRHAEALADFGAAIRLDPNGAGAYDARGNSFLALGRHAEALADYTAAIRIDPEHALAHRNKGVLHTRRDEWADALEAFETAARLGDPTGAQYAAQVRQMRGLGPAAVWASSAQQAFEAFIKADTPEALRRAYDRYPILNQPDLLAAIEEHVAGQVPSDQRVVFLQRLDSLVRVLTERGNH
jgi:tetratricopeptide (TPR) repeat protein